MKKITSLVLAVLMIIAICTIPAFASEESATQHYNEARTFAQNKKYFKAAEKYKEAAIEYYEAQNIEKAAEASMYAGVNYDKLAGSNDYDMYVEVYGYNNFDPYWFKNKEIRVFYNDAGHAFKNAQILYSRCGQNELSKRNEKYVNHVCELMGANSDYFDTNEVSFDWSSTRPDTEKTDIVDGYYIIYSAVDERMSLDLDGGHNAKNVGDNLHLWTNGDAKLFAVIKDHATGYYKIRSSVSDYFLEVEGSSTTNDANIYQSYETRNTNQRWIFEPAGDGYYYIRCVGGQYMEVDGIVNGMQPYNGVNIQSSEFTGATNQKFKLYLISTSVTGSVLSEGNIWISVGIAVAVVAIGTVAALVIVKKKKNTIHNS